MCQQPRKLCGAQVYYLQVKTHGCMLVAKKAVWHTSVLFTGNAKSLSSTSHLSITTGQISIKFIYFCTSYTQSYLPNLKKFVVYFTRHVFLKIALFSSHFSSSHSFTKVTLSQPKTPYSWINFFQN